MPEPRLTLEIPASSRFLATVAAFLRATAAESGFDEDSAEGIEIAAIEAVENVLDHARLGQNGRIKIQIWLDGDDLFIEIRDRGVPWPKAVLSGQVGLDMPPVESARGRGLAMMRALVDEVTPIPGPDGEKMLRLRKRLIRVEAQGSDTV